MRVASAFLILIGYSGSCFCGGQSPQWTPSLSACLIFIGTVPPEAAGPVLLILGPLLLIRRSWQRAAAVTAAIGCCILTFGAIWMLIDVALHENPSNRAFGFSVAGAICAITVLVDIAGVKIWYVAFRRPI